MWLNFLENKYIQDMVTMQLAKSKRFTSQKFHYLFHPGRERLEVMEHVFTRIINVILFSFSFRDQVDIFCVIQHI